jgi:predicted TIM-barrel fold metal-dependent hydrolase
MNSIDRRSFLKNSLLSAAAVTLSGESQTSAQAVGGHDSVSSASRTPGIIDTNVNLLGWPFRALKYRDTKALVAKLKKHRVTEAWAGNFEALLAKDMNGVNSRLADECRQHGPGFLIPFGSANLAWPDWEEDVRRCHEEHKMPGIRIYPGYQPFDLDHPGMEGLVKMSAERGLVLQIAFGMEDPRVHHPIINVGPVTFSPLLRIVQAAPNSKIQLLHFPGSIRGADYAQFMKHPNMVMDISRLEGNGAIGRMIGAVPGSNSPQVPVERVLFGSHAPYFPVETALLKLIESPLDVPQLDAIMRHNARRLLPLAKVC